MLPVPSRVVCAHKYRLCSSVLPVPSGVVYAHKYWLCYPVLPVPQDAMVRANALSVLVSVLGVAPPLPEVTQLLLRYAAPTTHAARTARSAPHGTEGLLTPTGGQGDEEEEDEQDMELVSIAWKMLDTKLYRMTDVAASYFSYLCKHKR